jgi:hypothetical protein
MNPKTSELLLEMTSSFSFEGVRDFIEVKSGKNKITPKAIIPNEK